jgi:succinate-semialdehyde dehydrogenase/glutarate-semialdehyde dehydrogenase
VVAETINIKNKALLKDQCYINGEWMGANDGSSSEVTNPANSERLGSLPNCGADETILAITAANEAQKIWAKTDAKERSSVLKNLHHLMLENQMDLATIITLEGGKPISESLGEIAYAASFFEWFSEEAKRVYGDLIPGHQYDRRTLVIKQPIGVVGCITPWNFPSAMLARKIAPAIAVGCSVVAKPAPETPFSATAMAYLSELAGVPKGIFNVVTGDAEKIGSTMTSHKDVKKITFTGSTAVGKHLLKASADSVKKVSLELGGHAPFIVFEDANLEAAVEGAVIAKYRNSGQTCVCANRIYVQSSIYDDFSQRFTEKASELVVGNGLDESTQQGPLISENAIEKVSNHIEDAKNSGAIITTGGNPHSLGGLFFEPTVLTGVSDEMLISKEETFGPVAPIFSFETEQEVIERANNTPYGLAAYFYTTDLAKSWRVSEQLDYGMVGLNTGIISTEMAPFGGVKESGIGREGSKYGVDDYLEIKYVSLAGIEE